MRQVLVTGGAGLVLASMAACSSPTAAPLVVAPAPAAPASAEPSHGRTRVVCSPTPLRIVATVAAPAGRLAPTDATTGVLCVYAGLNSPVAVGTLTRSVPVPDPSHLAGVLDEATPVSGIFNCPMDDGGVDAVVLGRPSGDTVVVEVERTGCQFATSTLSAGGHRLSPAGYAALHALDPTFSH